MKDISIAMFLTELEKQVAKKFDAKNVKAHYEFGTIGSKENVIKIVITEKEYLDGFSHAK